MDNDRDEVDLGKKEEEDRGRPDLIRDRFRLAVISICQSQAAKKYGMKIEEVVVTCIADLSFKLSDYRAACEGPETICSACWSETCKRGGCYIKCS